jgi:tRNA (cmo5U34)-methyltransferase
MTDSNRDNLFANPLGKVSGFVFDQAVVDVFPDMISRSVPGYETILSHTGELAHRYVQPQTRCYDLGCSLGGLYSGYQPARRGPGSADCRRGQ